MSRKVNEKTQMKQFTQWNHLIFGWIRQTKSQIAKGYASDWTNFIIMPLRCKAIASPCIQNKATRKAVAKFQADLKCMFILVDKEKQLSGILFCISVLILRKFSSYGFHQVGWKDKVKQSLGCLYTDSTRDKSTKWLADRQVNTVKTSRVVRESDGKVKP